MSEASVACRGVESSLGAARSRLAFQIEAGNWRLSPAFDIYPFPDRHRELKTWITEETCP